MDKTEILEPPVGCMEIPGYILVLKAGGWLTKAGAVTSVFKDRGVWATEEAAAEALKNLK